MYIGKKNFCEPSAQVFQMFNIKAGLPVGNPILGHNILGHFCPILGHFTHILGDGNKWHWVALFGSELHNFYEVTLCQRIIYDMNHMM